MESHEIATAINGLVAHALATAIDVDEALRWLSRIPNAAKRARAGHTLAQTAADQVWRSLRVRVNLTATIPELRARELFVAAFTRVLEDRLSA